MAIQTLPPMPVFKTDTVGKPAIPRWELPPVTREDVPWQALRTLDMSLMDGTPEQQAELLETCRLAIEEEGFLYLSNFGMTDEQIQRNFDLAAYCILGDGISAEERVRLEWDMSKGTFMGYKPRKGWGEKGKSAPDQIESFNWYQQAFDDDTLIPEKMKPFLDEIKAYAHHMHNEVNFRLQVLFARILGLPDRYIWDNYAQKGGILGETSYHRHQIYHPFEAKEFETATLIMHGHTDYGMTTIIPSQPIACLQMLGKDGEWRYLAYEPNRLMVNLGDALEVYSGGHFKATRHKVARPPRDQQHYTRVALISFNQPRTDSKLEPIMDAPLIKEKGLNKESDVFGAFCRRREEGMEIPTFGEWKHLRSVNSQAPPEKVVVVDGKKFKEQAFNGIKVLMPI